jgi:hypothetical protein
MVQCLVLLVCCLFSCNHTPKQQQEAKTAGDSSSRNQKVQSEPPTRPLKDGTYCFKNYNTPGYEYLTFTVAAGRISNGSGDGHSESEEASWIVSFSGVFEKDGTSRVEVVVENESGIQAPRLETWEVAENGLLYVNRGGNRVVTFKKVACE